MITLTHIHHHIEHTPILTDINLIIPDSGITALIGPNGAGKSTLLSLMARLQHLQSGQILLDNMDIAHTPSRQIARHLAILTQQHNIHSRITVADLLMFGRYPHHQGRISAADHAIVQATLARFGLTDLARRYLSALSGGQRQLALIAMTFCQQTGHVLLDEPLNNLDMFHARALMQRLRTLTNEQQLTTVMVVHDINMAAAYADTIIALKNGRVLLQGTPADIITPANLNTLFGINAEVLEHRGKKLVVHHL